MPSPLPPVERMVRFLIDDVLAGAWDGGHIQGW